MSDYRYRLTREVDEAPIYVPLCWVMLNPSTADEVQDDPTIRRVKSFTRRAGYSKLTVVNLFAYRATNPRELSQADIDPIGPGNNEAIAEAFDESARVVFAWGAITGTVRLRRMAEDRIAFVTLQARRLGHKPLCLATTSKGHPRHPLYLPNSAWFHTWPGWMEEPGG